MLTPTIDRLRHAVASQSKATPRSPVRITPDLPPIEQILRGDWHEHQHGRVFVRDEWFALDHAHGPHSMGSLLEADSEGLAQLLGAHEAPDPDRYAFFDIETTGLSGGTGTYIVLAGLGSFEQVIKGEPLAFRLRQYFLAGLQHEQAMLSMLAADLTRFDAVVTYNGRSFDVPVLESRLTMSRVSSPCGPLAHFDLLHAARRLYGHRMPGCRLADAERRLLGIDRPDDVPGSLIPAIYRDYLVAGRASPLRGVFRHNAEDVLSLVGVMVTLTDLLSREGLDPDDAVAVARWRERVGDVDGAMALYRTALPWLEGGDDWQWAAQRQAKLCKRLGMRGEAVTLWQGLWDMGDRRAGLELAKDAEHHSRRFEEAATIVKTLLQDAEEQEHQDLSHRLGRIQRRSSGASARTIR